MIVAHFADNAVIRVGSTVSHTGEYWGVQNVRVSVAVPHPSPPSLPSPPGQWDLLRHHVFPRDNVHWRNSDGSSIRDDQITTCGSVGTMLGGYEVFGSGAYVQASFSNLPAHTALRVQGTFIRVDQCTQACHSSTHSPRISFTEVRTLRA